MVKKLALDRSFDLGLAGSVKFAGLRQGVFYVLAMDRKC